MSNIIGIAASAPGSGKSSLAQALLMGEPEGVILPFAGPVKALADEFLRQVLPGVDPAAMADPSMKETPIHGLGVSYRHIAQTIGTEWGRTCISPEVWVEAWRRRATDLIARGATMVIADDVRFPNEVAAVRAMGGEVWHVLRSGSTVATCHASEEALVTCQFDRCIRNDGTLADLRAAAAAAARAAA